MKRQQDRESPVKNKRTHANSNRYDDSPRDRGTPDRRDRRGVNKSPNERRGRSRESSASIERGNMQMNRTSVINRDLYDDYSRPTKQPYTYKALYVTNLTHKVSDAAIREALQREFNRYGDVNVKVCHESNERVAYVYFRTGEDARDARHAKSRFVLFDKPVQVDPVLDRNILPLGRRNRSVTPDYVTTHGVRGVSPAHSTTSTNSVGRRTTGNRHNCLDRNVQPDYTPPHREPPRRDVREYHHMTHRRDDTKKEKFPNYLHHVPPEDDDKATRTLFVGNLEVTILETELRRIFERYGVVEDIDVKRPPPGQGNAYAFIKFLNLDMAHRAKVEMSGQYIGKFQCKIGYGKATPTTRIWVGGLGPWTSLSHLEREFDRFGAIRKIDFVKGENHAYIQYDSIDAAQAAGQEMRGFPLGGQDKRLRVDFADPGPYSYYQSPSRSTTAASTGSYRDDDRYAPPRRSGNRDLASADDYYDSLDNHWQRNNTYGSAQYDLHYDRLPRQARDQWQQSELDDRHDSGEYRGYSRNWWDDHPRNRNDTSNDRRKRPRTPDDDGPQDGRTGRGDDGVGLSYKHARHSNTPDHGDQDRTQGCRDNISPRRSRDTSNRRTSKERHSPVNSDAVQKNDSRETSGKDRSHDDARDTNSAYSRNKSGKIEPNHEEKKKSDNLKGGSVTVADSVTNLQDLAKCCPVAWHGGLVLKNSAFTSRMHVCSGDLSLVDSLMKDSSSDVPMLRITQRLRLDPPKLDDVSRRVTNSGTHGHCMLLTLPGSVQTPEDQSNSVQQRPLRNLVTYLKQKEAAGVVSLPGGTNVKKDGKELTGVLYAFPPCSFALDLLRRIAPNLTGDTSKEDHLVVVVVKGSA